MNITGQTQLVGLIGWPVSHSYSPAMHNACLEAHGIDWVYVPMPVHPDELEAAVRGLPALGFRGVNVTVPHKQAVIPYLDELDVAAEAMRAVNTIVIEKREGRNWLIGYNTDASGFMGDLVQLSVDVAGRDCLVIGAGGAARSVTYALATMGGRVQVLARRVEQARQLVQDLVPHLSTARLHFRPSGTRLSARPLSSLRETADNAVSPLIVNTTPLGMSPFVNRSVWPDSWNFPRNAFIYDLVYNPPQTKLMRQAELAGCRVANGQGMLIQQGALAFELWTGKEANIAVMSAAIEL